MNFKVGETIYHVYAFPATGKNWVDEVTVIEIGHIMMHSGAPSIFVMGKYKKQISLLDANVVPNKYNCHRIFKTLEEAETYAADTSQWRPLGISEEDWNTFNKESYLADYELNVYLDSYCDDYYEI